MIYILQRIHEKISACVDFFAYPFCFNLRYLQETYDRPQFVTPAVDRLAEFFHKYLK